MGSQHPWPMTISYKILIFITVSEIWDHCQNLLDGPRTYQIVDRACTLPGSVSWAKVENSNTGFRSTSICFCMSQTIKLAPESTLRFQFWVFEIQENGAKPRRRKTGVTCLQLAASATLIKVEDSKAQPLSFGF